MIFQGLISFFLANLSHFSKRRYTLQLNIIQVLRIQIFTWEHQEVLTILQGNQREKKLQFPSPVLKFLDIFSSEKTTDKGWKSLKPTYIAFQTGGTQTEFVDFLLLHALL